MQIFGNRAFLKTERAEPSRAFWPKARAKTEPKRAEPRLGYNTTIYPFSKIQLVHFKKIDKTSKDLCRGWGLLPGTIKIHYSEAVTGVMIKSYLLTTA